MFYETIFNHFSKILKNVDLWENQFNKVKTQYVQNASTAR